MTVEWTEDAAIAKVSAHPRVTFDDIEANIVAITHISGAAVVTHGKTVANDVEYAADMAETMSICLIVLKNGFTVIGHSAPASPDNFKRIGQKIAYENALRQIWPLMGYALKQRLYDRRDVRTVGKGSV